MRSYSFGFVGLFISQSFQMYKNKDVLQKKKKKEKKQKEGIHHNPLWRDDNNKNQSDRWVETGVKPKCISLRCSRQTRGNKNRNFQKLSPLP